MSLNALNSNVDFNNNGSKFKLKFNIKDSENISFVLLAKNRFYMSSDWICPNFAGAFLPDEKNITVKSFETSWDINYLSSGIPSGFDGKDLLNAQFQTSFLMPADNYRNTNTAYCLSL